jgi:hypothetical protein
MGTKSGICLISGIVPENMAQIFALLLELQYDEFGWKGKATNEMGLFCFCILCGCVSKEMFEHNKEVKTAMKQ